MPSIPKLPALALGHALAERALDMGSNRAKPRACAPWSLPITEAADHGPGLDQATAKPRSTAPARPGRLPGPPPSAPKIPTPYRGTRGNAPRGHLPTPCCIQPGRGWGKEIAYEHRGALRGTPGCAFPEYEPNATELPSCAPISAPCATSFTRSVGGGTRVLGVCSAAGRCR